MIGGLSLKSFKLIGVLVFIITISGTIISFADIDCENVPDSSGPVPMDLVEFCLGQEVEERAVVR